MQINQRAINQLYQEAARRHRVAIDSARLQRAAAAAFRRERQSATPPGLAIVALALGLIAIL